MKSFIAALSLALSAVASAQTATQVMSSAMSRFAANERIGMEQAGSIVTGGNRVNFSVVAYFMQEPDSKDSTAFLDATFFRNGQVVTRVVGDGVELWKFNPARNEFSASKYGDTVGHPTTLLASQSQQHFRGESAIIARLFADSWLTSRTKSGAWMPYVPLGETWVEFNDDKSLATVNVEAGKPVHTSMRYELSADGPGWRLDRIDYRRDDKRGTEARSTEWTVDLYEMSSFGPEVNFRFSPPRGAVRSR